LIVQPATYKSTIYTSLLYIYKHRVHISYTQVCKQQQIVRRSLDYLSTATLTMLSEGSREIEGARKRLAAAKTQVSSAKMMMEQAKAMLNSAQTLSDTADKEFKEAQTALEEAEKRWEVIDIDMDDSVVSKNSSGSNKQRKVSPNSSLTSRIRAAMQHELTSNAISKMYYMSGSIEDSSFTPILQVIYVKKISKEGFGDEERFKVSLRVYCSYACSAPSSAFCIHTSCHLPPPPPFLFRLSSQTVSTSSHQ